MLRAERSDVRTTVLNVVLKGKLETDYFRSTCALHKEMWPKWKRLVPSLADEVWSRYLEKTIGETFVQKGLQALTRLSLTKLLHEASTVPLLVGLQLGDVMILKPLMSRFGNCRETGS